MLQAGLGSGLRVRLSLSGVTPGERVDLSIRRVSVHCAGRADQLTQGQTRWSIPPPFRHACYCACPILSCRRTYHRRHRGAGEWNAGTALALAASAGPQIRGRNPGSNASPRSRSGPVPAARPRLSTRAVGPLSQTVRRAMAQRSPANAARGSGTPVGSAGHRIHWRPGPVAGTSTA